MSHRMLVCSLRPCRAPAASMLLLVSACCVPLACAADDPSPQPQPQLSYATADAELKVVRIDSSETESFLSMRADSTGRLFVGAREALFVYEPDPSGLYHPSRVLYRFPEHSWVYDIEIRGRDLYVLTLNALYIIEGGVEEREGLTPRRLLWGLPQGHVHQCFHGLAWGPEGDLYISQGDPLWYYGDFDRPDHWGHWTFFSWPDDTPTPYTGVGGVFRCRPDGSEFQIVARGLRNSCGLAYDADWNLFTNDNDHEGLPHAYVPGRLLHVTPHSDFSWPRGWMVSITPDRADMLESMIPDMGRSVPVGQAYYNDTFLPAQYRNNLLVARWGRRTVARYPLMERGASFKTTETPLLVGRDLARPVGIAVGRGGRLFATISYMAQNEASPTYQSDLVMITRADDGPPYAFDAYRATEAGADRLWQELSNPSWSRRYRAHGELLRRGGNLLIEAARRLHEADPNDPATAHLIWLAAAAKRDPHLATADRQAARDLLMRLSSDSDQRVRRHALRAIGEYYAQDPAVRPVVIRSLADPSPPVQQAALLACFEMGGPVPEQVLDGPARSDDSYLRQPATLLLASRSSVSDLQRLFAANDVRMRLAGVLAAGFRLTMPPATEAIPENLPLEPWRSEEVYLVQYADKKVDLRNFGRVGLFTLAEHWNAGPRSPDEEQLFGLLLARLDDSQEQIRLQAAHFLHLLNDPRSAPQVAKVRRESEQHRLAQTALNSISEVWAAGPFPDGDRGFDAVHEPEQKAVDLSATYESPHQTIAWKRVKRDYPFDFRKHLGPMDHSSVYAYLRVESPRKQQLMLLLGSDDGLKVWHNGQPVWTNDVDRAALPTQDVFYVDLEPGSNDLLIRVRNTVDQCMLYFHYRTLSPVAITLPEKLKIASLAERLKSAAAGDGGQTAVPPEFYDVDWAAAARSGDAERGRRLFSADGIGCAKCHAVRQDQPVPGGPSLVDASKRFTIAHLVESVLLPSKQVSPVFQATLLALADGRTVSGLVVGETAEKVDILLPDGNRATFAKPQILEQKLQPISPMPSGVVKKPEELRDLLTYLLSEGS